MLHRSMVVVDWDKGHFDHSSRDGMIANLYPHFCAHLGQSLRNVSHGNIALKARAGTTRGDSSCRNCYSDKHTQTNREV